MTSRTSPVSMTIPAWVRRPLRIRWWCRPEAASSEGIGARAASMFLSVRMRKVAPSLMYFSASTKTDVRAEASAFPSPSAGYRMSISLATMSGCEALRRRAMSSGGIEQPPHLDPVVHHPVTVRALARNAGLDLVVGDDPFLLQVYEKHLSRLQAALLEDLAGRKVHA